MAGVLAGVAASDRETIDRTGIRLTRTRTRPLGGRSGPVGDDPRSIGRFTVRHRLGMGGMSVVYEALDERIGRTVALKLMLAHDVGSDRERLRREAQALARLSHPNVVEVFEIGEHDDKPYVAMELVEGHALDRWLRLRERTPAEIVEVFAQAGEGLAAAHAQGLVHRDFKPGNVLVGLDGRVRVVDFGLVRESGSIEPSSAPDLSIGSPPSPSEISGGSLPAAAWNESLTRTGAMVGTPAYMSPEQLSGVAAGPASDQFAFCVSLFEALFRQHPFVADGNWQQLPYNVLEGRLQRPSHKHRVPVALGKVVMRGLALRPEARWPSMDVLLPQLRRALDRGGPRLRTTMMGVGVVVLGLGVLHGNAQSTVIDHCEQAASTMRASWGPAMRDDLRETWLGTKLPGASDTWSRVDVRLQAYADDWWGIHHAACDGPSHAVTTATCLARTADGLQMHVQMMAHPDETMLHNAVQMVGQLPSLDRCSAAIEAPPDESIAKDPPWHGELQRLDMLISAGKRKEAATLLDAMLGRTATERNPWLTAELDLRLGYIRDWDGDADAAGAAFEGAYLEAKRLGKDQLAAEAALAMLQLFGEFYYRPAEATRWMGHARAETERVGDPLLTSSYLNGAGRALRGGGELEEALALHRQALEILLALPTPHPIEVSRSHFQIGSALGLLGRGSEGRPHLEEALRIQEQELGPSHPMVAASLTNIGVFLTYEGHDEEALVALSRALEISEETMPDNPSAGWVALANIGTILARQGRLHESAATMRRYLDGYRRQHQLGPEDTDVTLAATRCEIEVFENHLERALPLCEQALALQRSEPESQSGAMPHTALGLVLSRLGRFDEAIASLERASALAQAAEHKGAGMKVFDVQAAAETQLYLGRVLALGGRYDAALVALGQARDAFARNFGDEYPLLLEVETETCDALLGLGRADEARPRLLDVVRALDAGEEPRVLRHVHALTVLARAELDAGDVTSAREHAERAVSLADGLADEDQPRMKALARFALARALGSSRPERARAVALAQQAEEALAALGGGSRRELEQAQAWLEEHGARVARRPT